MTQQEFFQSQQAADTNQSDWDKGDIFARMAKPQGKVVVATGKAPEVDLFPIAGPSANGSTITKEEEKQSKPAHLQEIKEPSIVPSASEVKV
jgi:hypothetical protein